MWEDFLCWKRYFSDVLFLFLFLAFMDVYKPEQKKREKSKQTNPASLQSSVIFSFLNEKLTFWWLCVCVKHKIQPYLNSEVRVFGILYGISVLGDIYLLLLSTIFKVSVPNHYREIWENIYFFYVET